MPRAMSAGFGSKDLELVDVAGDAPGLVVGRENAAVERQRQLAVTIAGKHVAEELIVASYPPTGMVKSQPAVSRDILLLYFMGAAPSYSSAEHAVRARIAAHAAHPVRHVTQPAHDKPSQLYVRPCRCPEVVCGSFRTSSWDV